MTTRCTCCGIGVSGQRAVIRRCIVCDQCDRLHGDELVATCGRMVRAGQLTPGHVLARVMMDDAHLAGMIEYRDDPDGMTVTAWVPVPVPRWRVVIGRAWARGEAPDISRIVGSVLDRYLPGPASRANLDGIAQDITDALGAIDPNVLNCKVGCKVDQLDPQHLIIEVQTKTAAAPGMVDVLAPDVELPADIMSRPRGSA